MRDVTARLRADVPRYVRVAIDWGVSLLVCGLLLKRVVEPALGPEGVRGLRQVNAQLVEGLGAINLLTVGRYFLTTFWGQYVELFRPLDGPGALLLGAIVAIISLPIKLFVALTITLGFVAEHGPLGVGLALVTFAVMLLPWLDNQPKYTDTLVMTGLASGALAGLVVLLHAVSLALVGIIGVLELIGASVLLSVAVATALSKTEGWVDYKLAHWLTAKVLRESA
jgi:hypothetical protein